MTIPALRNAYCQSVYIASTNWFSAILPLPDSLKPGSYNEWPGGVDSPVVNQPHVRHATYRQRQPPHRSGRSGARRHMDEGETFEGCLCREIMEKVGLANDDIQNLTL